MNYIYMFLLVIYSLRININTINARKNESIFVPTKEWQILNKGIPIPSGLHVRYNFQTGVTEVKLIDSKKETENIIKKPNNLQKSSVALYPDEFLMNQVNNIKKEELNHELQINFDELKSVLKGINLDKFESKNNQLDQLNKIKKFKTYSELKADLETLNMNISTDSEILTSLFNEFEPYKEFITSKNLNSVKIQDILEILDNMEYLLHQIDNAQIFSDMEGMEKIVSPALNSTNSEIKAEALKLLGTSVQSNPKVQLKALKNDFVQKLLHVLTISNNIKVKSRCLFALGALIRHFPAAQKAFLNNGGLEIFGMILTDGHFQIQIRIMNLINDLIIEHQNLGKIQNEFKIKEYNLMKFEYKLSMQKYCQHLVDLMIQSLKNLEINDFHEIVCESMIILSFICKSEYTDKKEVLLQEIQKVLVIYHDSSNISENTENWNSYHSLLKKLKNIIDEKQHDEL